MILGLFLERLGLPVIPMILIILSIIVLVSGFAFMIFRHVFEKGESDIDPALFKKISVIATWVFLIYAFIEIVAACACVVVNDACRSGYHYDISKANGTCKFCSIFKSNDNRSYASDILTLGIYFDAFIVNSFVTNSIKIIKEKLAAAAKK